MTFTGSYHASGGQGTKARARSDVLICNAFIYGINKCGHLLTLPWLPGCLCDRRLEHQFVTCCLWLAVLLAKLLAAHLLDLLYATIVTI